MVGGVGPSRVAGRIGDGHAEVAVRGSSAVLATVLAIRAHLALRAVPHPPVLALTSRTTVSCLPTPAASHRALPSTADVIAFLRGALQRLRQPNSLLYCLPSLTAHVAVILKKEQSPWNLPNMLNPLHLPQLRTPL